MYINKIQYTTTHTHTYIHTLTHTHSNAYTYVRNPTRHTNCTVKPIRELVKRAYRCGYTMFTCYCYVIALRHSVAS